MVTDVVTGEQRVFERLSDESSLTRYSYAIYWSQGKSYALIEHKTCTEYQCPVVTIDLFQWETGQRTRISDELSLAECNEVKICSRDLLWSPDEQFAVLQDINGHFYLLEAATGSIYPVISEKVDEWIWLPDGDLMVAQAGYDGVARYDPQTHTLDSVTNIEPDIGRWFFFSPDGAFAGFARTLPVIVQNLETGELNTWQKHSATTHEGVVMDFNWSNNSQWFFSGGNTQSMDFRDSRAIMIHRVGDTNRRELTLCYDVKSCVGFLPDHVLPHLAPG